MQSPPPTPLKRFIETHSPQVNHGKREVKSNITDNDCAKLKATSGCYARRMGVVEPVFGNIKHTAFTVPVRTLGDNGNGLFCLCGFR